MSAERLLGGEASDTWSSPAVAGAIDIWRSTDALPKALADLTAALRAEEDDD